MFIAIAVYNPDIKSSIIIPQPPGKNWAINAGNGLIISKSLYKMNPTIIHNFVCGTSDKNMIHPTISSITICLESFLENNFSAFVDTATPRKNKQTDVIIHGRLDSGINKHTNPNKLPTVPGIIGLYPRPNPVAIVFTKKLINLSCIPHQ